MEIVNNIKRAFNAFFNKDPTYNYMPMGAAYSTRPDRVRFTRGNERSIITAVYNRIAVDAAAINIEHVRLDEDGRYLESIQSGLNNCINLEANIDQSGRMFMQDVVMSMLDEGCVALVPTDYKTTTDTHYGSYKDIITLRTAKITEWYPDAVKVYLWNEISGQKEEIKLPKYMVGIIENPFYSVINEPSSTMQRLVRKLNMLDAVDEQNASGKLDLIIQLPYVVRNKARREQAEARRKDIEMQLAGSKYGIAYTDGTEHITQLNRSVENNMMSQIEYLTNLLYSQLGITQSIMDGTANESTMINYYNRTIEPIVSAIVDELRRKFLTKIARSQRQSVIFFRDPFKLTTLEQVANIADKLTKIEVATPNEIRQIIGWKPSSDPKADELHNSSLAKSTEEIKQENAQQNQEQVQDDSVYLRRQQNTVNNILNNSS